MTLGLAAGLSLEGRAAPDLLRVKRNHEINSCARWFYRKHSRKIEIRGAELRNNWCSLRVYRGDIRVMLASVAGMLFHGCTPRVLVEVLCCVPRVVEGYTTTLATV